MANALSERNYNVTIIYFEQKQGKPGFPLNKSVTLINVLNIFPSKSVSLNFFEKLKCFSLDKIKQK